MVGRSDFIIIMVVMVEMAESRNEVSEIREILLPSTVLGLELLDAVVDRMAGCKVFS